MSKKTDARIGIDVSFLRKKAFLSVIDSDMYFFTLPGFKCLFVIQEIIVFKEQLVCEDSCVKNNLLLLQFTLQFLFRVTSVLEQHFCNFFDLSLDVEVEAPPSGPVLMFDNFDFDDLKICFFRGSIT